MDVSIVKCKSYIQEEVDAAVSESLNIIRFQFKDKTKVLLKPNLLTYKRPEDAVTTHPAVVGAVCKVLKEHDCEIYIGDSSGIGGGTQKSFETSGISAVAKKCGAKVIIFEAEEKIEIRHNKRKIIIPKILKDVDLIINLPKLKTHSLCKYTGAVKNMFGCIPGGKKSGYHAEFPTEESFSGLLVDIYEAVMPGLTIMDGIVGMEGNGPSNGNIKKTGLIMAAENGVALDIVASQIIGFDPFEIYTNKIALTRGLCKDKIQTNGRLPSIPYKKSVTYKGTKLPLLSKFVQKHVIPLVTLKPRIEKNCRKCFVCEKHCPVHAIKVPEIDDKKCILCYCCHELCPYNAISLKRNKLIEQMYKIYSKKSSKGGKTHDKDT